MKQIATSFAGLSLANPIIVSSSGLTDSVDKIRRLEAAGAGAVVLKSVFEEQISMQADSLQGYGASEADDYLNVYVRSHALNEHIHLIKEAKKVCHIPVIASINCYTDSEWTDFAQLMEQAGADALEVNILSLQTDKDYRYGSFEQRHVNILRRVKAAVHIPVIMKLGSYFTNLVALIEQLHANGADGIVLFNRLYRPDIDIERMAFTSSDVLSSSAELADKIRWTAIASAKVPQADYAVSGGVHSGTDVVKSILAGASAVEVCSLIYERGEQEIEKLKQELSHWMERKGYESLSQFKGKLNAKGDATPFERTQFMKYYSNHE